MKDSARKSLVKTLIFRVLVLVMVYGILSVDQVTDPFILAVQLNVAGFFLYYIFERVWNYYHEKQNV